MSELDEMKKHQLTELEKISGMTSEEALNIMSQMINDEEGFLSDNTVEAHKMAIQALSQEPCDDAVSRQAVKVWLEEMDNKLNPEKYNTIAEYYAVKTE